MVQAAFIVSLYTLGFAFGLLLRRRVPFAFISITGYLWGSLFWVAGVQFCLITGIPYTGLTMLMILSLGFVLLLGLHIRQGTWRLSRHEWAAIGGMILLLGGIAVLSSVHNYSVASADSVTQTLFGRTLAYEGLTKWVSHEMARWGIFLAALQSASVLLDESYLYATQPAFGATFVLLFFYLCQYAVRSEDKQRRWAAWGVAALSAATLTFGTFFVFFQMFYIHNNFLSAIYLLAAIVCFWLSLRDQEPGWLVFGIAALVAFSLLRTEAPLFAIVFLALLISASQDFPFRIRFAFSSVYIALISLWYIFLLFRASDSLHQLNDTWIFMILGMLAAFEGGVALTRLPWIERRVLPWLSYILTVALLGVITVAYAMKGVELKHSIRITADNMLFSQWWHETWASNWWGITWLVVLALLVLAMLLPRIPREKLFVFGIPAFFMLLFAMVFGRDPYRVGWGDSGNRMLTHILPVIVFYLFIKFYHGLFATPADTTDFVRERRPFVLAIIGASLTVFLIRYFLYLL